MPQTDVDCPTCGRRLSLPAELPEGGEFACRYCSSILRNDDALRRFRWDSLTPDVRRYGTTRLGLWLGLGAATLWLPLLAAALFVRNSFEPLVFAAIALPYVLLLLALVRRRARTPPPLWQMRLIAALGTFALYVTVLLYLAPGYAALFEPNAGPPGGVAVVGLVGLAALVIGAVGMVTYRRRASELPKAEAR